MCFIFTGKCEKEKDVKENSEPAPILRTPNRAILQLLHLGGDIEGCPATGHLKTEFLVMVFAFSFSVSFPYRQLLPAPLRPQRSLGAWPLGPELQKKSNVHGGSPPPLPPGSALKNCLPALIEKTARFHLWIRGLSSPPFSRILLCLYLF